MSMYQTHILKNGLKVIHQQVDGKAAWCGLIIGVGSRDERPEEEGIAHFIEHVIFKGTEKRKAFHILSRIEDVGGELNAYTTKEDTCIYASFLARDYERALELFADIVFHSVFPEKEIEKEQLFAWMRKMAGTLACVHKCRGAPCYQYVNPYSMIIAEDEELYFLDLKAASNQEMLIRMQKRTIREHFLPEEEAYYQRASVTLDLYGLARTYQYLLAETEVLPDLNKKEILKLEKIISRCLNRQSKKACQSAQEIKRMIPSYKNEEEKERSKGKYFRKWLYIAAAVVVIILGRSIFAGNSHSTNSYSEKSHAINSGNDVKAAETQTGVDKKDAAAHTAGKKEIAEQMQTTEMELGSLYFLKLEDYEKSRQHFEAACAGTKKTDKESGIAAGMAAVSACLAEKTLPEEELKQALEQTALLLEEKEDAIYYRCVLKGYTFLDAKEQREELLRLGIQYRALGEKEGQEEVTQWMAMAYEQNGKKSDAAKMYEELLAVEGKRAEREELYRKVTELFLADKKNDDAMRRIREGVTEYPDSVELQVLKLRVTCKEKEKNRRACRKALERAVKNRTDIQKNEDFRKLLQEQGFQMKGEKVCEKE